MSETDIPETAQFETDGLVEWLENRDWNTVGENKYKTINRHQYIAQSWFDGDDARIFSRILEEINASGVSSMYNGDEYKYVFANGFKYWISESHYSPGVMLNRRQPDPDEYQATLDDM